MFKESWIGIRFRRELGVLGFRGRQGGGPGSSIAGLLGPMVFN